MKRLIILTLTVAGGLYAQTSSPEKHERDQKQHKSKSEIKSLVKPCEGSSAYLT